MIKIIKKLPIYTGVLILFYIAMLFIYNFLTTDIVTTTITKTESKIIEGESVYMIYTKHGVFRNEDQWLELKFNSSDIYSKLIPNKTVTFKEVGIRNNYLSKYPNIIKIVKTTTNTKPAP
jgi:hypothetical protein